MNEGLKLRVIAHRDQGGAFLRDFTQKLSRKNRRRTKLLRFMADTDDEATRECLREELRILDKATLRLEALLGRLAVRNRDMSLLQAMLDAIEE